MQVVRVGRHVSRLSEKNAVSIDMMTQRFFLCFAVRVADAGGVDLCGSGVGVAVGSETLAV